MLFSEQEHMIYDKSPLREVICQLRFPTILSIEKEEPADFQEAVRSTFPRYMARQEQPAAQLKTLPNGQTKMETPPAVRNYHFISGDGLWKLNLTRDFIALSTLQYTSWRDFAAKLDIVLAQFIEIYHPAFFERIGLRYVNIISREKLSLEGTPWRGLIAPAYLGCLSQPDVDETQVSKCSLDFEMALDGSCHAKVHAGPGLVKNSTPDAPQDTEVKFILDFDLFMGGSNIPVNFCGGGLETLHAHAATLFRGALTDELHNAMQ